jgi:hypothetical protein
MAGGDGSLAPVAEVALGRLEAAVDSGPAY